MLSKKRRPSLTARFYGEDTAKDGLALRGSPPNRRTVRAAISGATVFASIAGRVGVGVGSGQLVLAALSSERVLARSAASQSCSIRLASNCEVDGGRVVLRRPMAVLLHLRPMGRRAGR